MGQLLPLYIQITTFQHLLKGLHPLYLYFCHSTVNLGSLYSLKAWKTRKTNRSRMALMSRSATWPQFPHRSLEIHSQNESWMSFLNYNRNYWTQLCDVTLKPPVPCSPFTPFWPLSPWKSQTPFHTDICQSGCVFTYVRIYVCAHRLQHKMNLTMSPFSPGTPIIPLSPCLPWAAERHSGDIIAMMSLYN